MNYFRWIGVFLLALGCTVAAFFYGFIPKEVPILKVVVDADVLPLKYDCGLLETAEEVSRFKSVPQLHEQDLSKVNWVYSTLPITHILYSSRPKMITIEPSQAKKDNHIYFFAIPKKYSAWVKMTAVANSSR